MTTFPAGSHLAAQLRGPLAHAYLISGNTTEGRLGLAGLMARSLVCISADERPCDACTACEKAVRTSHPDIMAINPIEGKREIPVATVREIVSDAPTLPNEADHKVYIVTMADALNVSAQNAFLKVLEEPPSFVTFLLLAENPLTLLPTIRSRCVQLSLSPTASEEVSCDLSDSASELVDAFFTAFDAGALSLLEFCAGLEKAVKEDKQILSAFVAAGYARAVTELARQSGDRGRRMAVVTLFDSLRDDLIYNVSAGHISGKILATLL